MSLNSEAFVIVNIVSVKTLEEIMSENQGKNFLLRFTKPDNENFFRQLELVEAFEDNCNSQETIESMWSSFREESSIFKSALDLLNSTEEFSDNVMITFEGCRVSHPTENIRKIPERVITKLVSTDESEVEGLSVVFTSPVKVFDFYAED